MMQIVLDTAELEAMVRAFHVNVKFFTRQLATLTCQEGLASLMAEIRTACPVSQKVGPAISMYRGGKMRKMQSHGHLRDYLTGMVVPQEDRAHIVIQQSGNFNSDGKPYLNYVIMGTSPSKGRYVPGIDARLRRSRVEGYKSKVAQAKKRYRGQWRKHVSARTVQGAEEDIGTHPGTPPNDFILRGFSNWIGKGGHQLSLSKSLNALWSQIFSKGMFLLRHPRKAISAQKAFKAGEVSAAAGRQRRAYRAYQRQGYYGG